MSAELRRLATELRCSSLRGVVTRVDDTTKAQKLQITARDGEIYDAEHFQGFGSTGVPKMGTEVVILQLAGGAGIPVVVASESRDHRPRGASDGDKILYDAHGNQIRLTSAGIALGEGASLGVARTSDPVASVAADDAVFWAWLAAVDAFVRPLAVAALVTLPPVPTALTGKITGGSATVKAVD